MTWIRIRRASDVRGSEITGESLYLGRREFLRRAAAAAGVVASTSLIPGCMSAGEADAGAATTD